MRTPSRGERDSDINFLLTLDLEGGVPAFATLTRNPDVDSERLLALEAGYRMRASRRLSLDVAAFYSRYADVLDTETMGLLQLDDPRRLVVPNALRNDRSPAYGGVEAAVDVRVQRGWLLRATTGYAQETPTLYTEVRSRHQHQSALHTQIDIGPRWRVDGSLRHTGSHRNAAFESLAELQIDAWTSLDLAVRWRPTAQLELSVVGQNLLQDRHTEFARINFNAVAARVQRGAYLSLTWRP